jgi:quercetin dioxygenase-like cupin family protein
LRESLYAPDQRPDDGVGASDTPSLRLLRAGEATWRLDRGILVGLLVRTEHLTAGTLRIVPGQTSVEESHDGDELLYALSGAVRVSAGDVDEVLASGDGFYIPSGVSHRVAAPRARESRRRCSALLRATERRRSRCLKCRRTARRAIRCK